MQKKIIAIAFILLMLVFAAVACNKHEIGETPNYESVYTTDGDGNLYVTNVYGDLIPVTTGKDGSMELIEDLYTKTKEQADQEKADSEKQPEDEESPKGEDGGQGGNEDPDKDKNEQEPNKNGIQVGTDSITGEGREAVIVW